MELKTEVLMGVVDMEVDKVANMVVDMVVDKAADMVLYMVVDTEAEKVADIELRIIFCYCV